MIESTCAINSVSPMEIPKHWRLKKQRYALVGEVCPHCDAKIFPPKEVCPDSGSYPTGNGNNTKKPIKVEGIIFQAQIPEPVATD